MSRKLERETVKTYYECLDEISQDELFDGLLGYGLFSEKIPNFLSSEEFLYFFKNSKNKIAFKQKTFRYIKYENIRNINIPRILSIPNPLAYYKHCNVLKDNWDKIKNFFKDKTKNDKYKISRIHIRKLIRTKKIFRNDYENDKEEKLMKHKLFEMNYKNYKIDGSPEQNIFIDKCYKVKADISNCFPSIYTHAITWALAGKEKAKIKKNQKELDSWYDKLDSSITWLNYNETHGLLIGPHSSNLVSEIILVSIDNKLAKYKYIRNIDDYICYVSSIDEANQFLLDLSQSLREFNLTLNHKKTEIIKLPTPFEEDWTRKLKLFKMETYKKQIKYTGVVPFFDTALELMKENKYNASILNYAIQILLKKKMTKNAQTYFINIIHHLVLIYPYLIPLLEKIFDKKLIQLEQISIISTDIFKLGIEKNIYEAMIYALYFALKYNFRIQHQTMAEVNQVRNKEDCILMLISYLYDKKYKKDLKFYIDTAKSCIIEVTIGKDNIKIIDDEFWLFSYEVLRIESPKNLKECIDWKQLEDRKITFLNRENLAIKGIKGV